MDSRASVEGMVCLDCKMGARLVSHKPPWRSRLEALWSLGTILGAACGDVECSDVAGELSRVGGGADTRA